MPRPLHSTTFPSPKLQKMSKIYDKKALMCAPSEPCYHSTLSANLGKSNPLALSTVPDSTTQSSSCQASPLFALNPSTIQRPPPEAGPQEVQQDEPGRQAPAENQDDATSCETAAWIIANSRGHDDAEVVRAELGCPSNADCTVKNSAVFHAMDR